MMTEANEAAITREEMVAMFGEAMPVQAVNLLWNSPPGKTLGQVRAELRHLAATLPTITQVSQDVEPAADPDAQILQAVRDVANERCGIDGVSVPGVVLVTASRWPEFVANAHAVSQDVPAPAAGVREAALEEAAKVADDAFMRGALGQWDRGYNSATSHIAQRIRALNPTGAA